MSELPSFVQPADGRVTFQSSTDLCVYTHAVRNLLEGAVGATGGVSPLGVQLSPAGTASFPPDPQHAATPATTASGARDSPGARVSAYSRDRVRTTRPAEPDPAADPTFVKSVTNPAVLVRRVEVMHVVNTLSNIHKDKSAILARLNDEGDDVCVWFPCRYPSPWQSSHMLSTTVAVSSKELLGVLPDHMLSLLLARTSSKLKVVGYAACALQVMTHLLTQGAWGEPQGDTLRGAPESSESNLCAHPRALDALFGSPLAAGKVLDCIMHVIHLSVQVLHTSGRTGPARIAFRRASRLLTCILRCELISFQRPNQLALQSQAMAVSDAPHHEAASSTADPSAASSAPNGGADIGIPPPAVPLRMFRAWARHGLRGKLLSMLLDCVVVVLPAEEQSPVNQEECATLVSLLELLFMLFFSKDTVTSVMCSEAAPLSSWACICLKLLRIPSPAINLYALRMILVLFECDDPYVLDHVPKESDEGELTAALIDAVLKFAMPIINGFPFPPCVALIEHSVCREALRIAEMLADDSGYKAVACNALCPCLFHFFTTDSEHFQSISASVSQEGRGMVAEEVPSPKSFSFAIAELIYRTLANLHCFNEAVSNPDDEDRLVTGFISHCRSSSSTKLENLRANLKWFYSFALREMTCAVEEVWLWLDFSQKLFRELDPSSDLAKCECSPAMAAKIHSARSLDVLASGRKRKRPATYAQMRKRSRHQETMELLESARREALEEGADCGSPSLRRSKRSGRSKFSFEDGDAEDGDASSSVVDYGLSDQVLKSDNVTLFSEVKVVATTTVEADRSLSNLWAELARRGVQKMHYVSKNVTHLVVKPDDLTRFSGKIDKAWARGVPVVSMRYFEKCLEKNELLPVEPYRFKPMG